MLSEKPVVPVLMRTIEKSVPIDDLRHLPLLLGLIDLVHITASLEIILVTLGVSDLL